MGTDDELLHASEFRARRRRVLGAAGRLFGGFAVGLAALIALRHVAPELGDSDAAIAPFVGVLALLGLDYWRTLRRDWRCPACEVRWSGDELLASSTWNHCAECGAALRGEAERFENVPLREPHPDSDLALRYRTRRRTAFVAAGAVACAGLAGYAWVHARGLGDLAEQVVLMVFIATAVATVVYGLRCPRCETGIVKGGGHHCPRCGWSLPEAAPV